MAQKPKMQKHGRLFMCLRLKRACQSMNPNENLSGSLLQSYDLYQDLFQVLLGVFPYQRWIVKFKGIT